MQKRFRLVRALRPRPTRRHYCHFCCHPRRPAEELAEFDRAYEAGEAELVPDDEVRRRLQARGLHLGPRPSNPEAGSPAS